MTENQLALEIWADAQLLGWPMARDLHDLSLTPKGRGDLLSRVRVIADELGRIQREKNQHGGAA